MATTTRPALARSWKRLDGVDLLRGLAILLVLMNHVNMQLLFAHVPYTRGLPRQLVSSLVWSGQYGVQIFFAVSGFLITATSLRRWGTLGSLQPRAFYLLRFARIAPLFLLLLAVLSLLHLAGVHPFVIAARVGGLRGALGAALTFRINLLEATRGYLPGSWDVLWSLSVEEMFYLFFPVACLLFRRWNLFVALLLAFVVMGPFGRTVLAHGNETWREYSYLGSMDAIALGSLTALLLPRVHRSQRLVRAAGIAGGICVGFVLLCSRSAPVRALERAGLDMTLLAGGACLLIASASLSQGRSPGVLAPLRWIGERSYEIYLSHMFVVVALFAVFLKQGKPVRGVPLLFAAVLVTAALFGALIARVYSEPMNRWLRGRLGTRQPGAVMESAAAAPLL